MLKDIKVIEFEGLAPSVFCGMYFVDQGAEVTIISRPEPPAFSMPIHKNIMNRNKKCVTLSLKQKEDIKILTSMIKEADIVIDPFRPGVLQKLGFGPQDLHKINPQIILLRVSGYGQQTSMALKPGHDLNYIAVSGILMKINRDTQKIQFPMNLLADFISASLGISGTLAALKQRKKIDKGRQIDCSLADGCSYFANLSEPFQKQSTEYLKPKHMKIKETQYVITSKRQISQQEVSKLMENTNYYRNSELELQISKIKNVSNLKNSILKNPFSQNIPESLLPKRGQNNQQIKRKYKDIKPKL